MSFYLLKFVLDNENDVLNITDESEYEDDSLVELQDEPKIVLHDEPKIELHDENLAEPQFVMEEILQILEKVRMTDMQVIVLLLLH